MSGTLGLPNPVDVATCGCPSCNGSWGDNTEREAKIIAVIHGDEPITLYMCPYCGLVHEAWFVSWNPDGTASHFTPSDCGCMFVKLTWSW
jgi:hypothetical protein